MRLLFFLVFLTLGPYLHAQACLFPFSDQLDSVYTALWINQFPEASAEEQVKLRAKRLKTRKPKALIDSLYKEAYQYCRQRLGDSVMCRQWRPGFPHFFGEEDKVVVFNFLWHEKPLDKKSSFIEWQLAYYFEKNSWILRQYPMELPDCAASPDNCIFRLDEQAARNALHGKKRYDDQLLIYRDRNPFLFRLELKSAAGECMDSIWLFDRRTGALSVQPIQRNPQCVTFRELIERTPVILEAQNTGRGYSFWAGDDIVTTTIYRVLQVFKGDSIPAYIEVLQPGGQIGHQGQSLSHGTYAELPAEGVGLLFLQAFSTRYAFYENMKPAEQLRYFPFIPFSDAFSYGRPNGIIRADRAYDPENRIFKPMEEITGRKRRRIAYAEPKANLRSALIQQGYGYLAHRTGIIAWVDTFSEEQSVLALRATPAPLYLHELTLFLDYDTAQLGSRPIASGRLQLDTANLPRSYFSAQLPAYYTLTVYDEKPGRIGLKFAMRDKAAKTFILPADDVGLFMCYLRFPEKNRKASRMRLAPVTEQPGGKYMDFDDGKLKELGFLIMLAIRR